MGMNPIEAAVRDATEDYKLMRASTRQGAQISPREYAARTQRLVTLVAQNPDTVKHIHKKDMGRSFGSKAMAIGATAGLAFAGRKLPKTLATIRKAKKLAVTVENTRLTKAFSGKGRTRPNKPGLGGRLVNQVKQDIPLAAGASILAGAIAMPIGRMVGSHKAKKKLMATNQIYHTPGATEHLVNSTYSRDSNTFEAQKRKILRNASS
jgi:hypothetical protein